MHELLIKVAGMRLLSDFSAKVCCIEVYGKLIGTVIPYRML